MMSRTKKRKTSAGRRLDLVFRALGDQTRRALLTRLARRAAMVTELAEPFAMSLPAVSRHIRVLEGARLVVRKVDGRVHRCSLGVRPLKSVETWLRTYRHFWEENLEALARYVEKDRRERHG